MRFSAIALVFASWWSLRGEGKDTQAVGERRLGVPLSSPCRRLWMAAPQAIAAFCVCCRGRI